MNSTIPKLPIRPFRITDTKAIQDCRVTIGLLEEDLALFTALAPNINEDWLTEWETNIQAAEAVPTDQQHQNQSIDLTDDVKAAMEQVRRKNAQVKFAAMQAYEDDAGKYAAFGFNDYDGVRQSDADLQLYAERLHSTAVEHQAALSAVGWDTTATATIDTVAQALRDADDAQEEHKRKRKEGTALRINTYTTMWKKRQLVAQAAKIIFMDDYGKYQKYLLPASEGNPEDFAIMGVVQDASSNAPIEYAEARIDSLDLTVLTDESGTYGLADNIPPGEYTLAISKEGYATYETTVSVTSADDTLTVNANLVAS